MHDKVISAVTFPAKRVEATLWLALGGSLGILIAVAVRNQWSHHALRVGMILSGLLFTGFCWLLALVRASSTCVTATITRHRSPLGTRVIANSHMPNIATHIRVRFGGLILELPIPLGVFAMLRNARWQVPLNLDPADINAAAERIGLLYETK